MMRRKSAYGSIQRFGIRTHEQTAISVGNADCACDRIVEVRSTEPSGWYHNKSKEADNADKDK